MWYVILDNASCILGDFEISALVRLTGSEENIKALQKQGGGDHEGNY
jgi:hypothetical protein